MELTLGLLGVDWGFPVRLSWVGMVVLSLHSRSVAPQLGVLFAGLLHDVLSHGVLGIYGVSHLAGMQAALWLKGKLWQRSLDSLVLILVVSSSVEYWVGHVLFAQWFGSSPPIRVGVWLLGLSFHLGIAALCALFISRRVGLLSDFSSEHYETADRSSK
jgi:polyferredoxin